ncbi:MAG: NUDIX hydrolase [Candidatus Paceibacterota bacterium]
MQKDINEEHEIFYVTQDVILFNERNELLALRHFTGKWLLAGGHMNKGEGWQNALDREIQEETGIVGAEIGEIFSVDSWKSFEGANYGVFFLGKTKSDKIELSDEHTEFKWLKSLQEVEELDWWCAPLRERIVSAWKKVNAGGVVCKKFENFKVII